MVDVAARVAEAFEAVPRAAFLPDSQRRHAGAIDRFDVRAAANQLVGEFGVLPIDGPVQRRCAVNLRSVDVDFLQNQLLNCGAVASLRSISNLAFASAGHECRGNDDQRDT